MSRYYNEDWQRRKAYLIRSLFHDIPNQVLSPVLEESIESSQAHVATESTRTSDTQYTEKSYESYEDQLRSESETVPSTESSGSDPVPADTGIVKSVIRSFSPLPPLIIEVEPNKHDEEEEFYTVLLHKIRKIYRKMFLEGKNISDGDFVESDIEKMRDLIEESFSSVDFESTSNNHANLIEDNNFADMANFDKTRNSIEDVNDTKSSDCEDIDLDEDLNDDMDEMDQELSISNEEPTYFQMTFKADIHIDGTPRPLVKPSPIYEEPLTGALLAPIDEIAQSLPLENWLRDTTSSSKVSTSEATPSLVYESSSHDETPTLEREAQVQLDLVRTPDSEKTHKEPLPSQTYEKASLETLHHPASASQLDVALGIDNEELVKSPVLTCRSEYKRPKGDQLGGEKQFQDMQVDIRPQSTTEGKVEVFHGDVLNKSKEDPFLILRFRRAREGRSFSNESSLTFLEENQDPASTLFTEDDNHVKEVEVMRTPRLVELRESIPTGITRFSCNIDDRCDQNIIAPNVSDVTASESIEHISTIQQQHSGEIDDVLATIFNTTPEVSRQSAATGDNKISSRSSKTRKRRIEEKSVQTLGVSWNDLRDNFFVGTPKILKLCSCMNHNCW